MKAALYNIAIEKGTYVELPFRLGTGEDEDFEPTDVTGWTAKSQVRPNVAGDLLHEWQIDIDGPSGTFMLVASDEITTAWTWTSGVYDIEITPPDGKTKRLAKGTITLDPDVTR